MAVQGFAITTRFFNGVMNLALAVVVGDISVVDVVNGPRDLVAMRLLRIARRYALELVDWEHHYWTVLDLQGESTRDASRRLAAEARERWGPVRSGNGALLTWVSSERLEEEGLAAGGWRPATIYVVSAYEELEARW